MASQFRLTAQAKVFSIVAAVVVVADQITKWLAVSGLTESFGKAATFSDKMSHFLWDRHPLRASPVAVVDNFWHFRYVENPGAAWGFLSGSASALRTPFFLLVSIFAMGFIIAYFKKTLPQQRILRLGLALVFGGAIGNFLDRVRLGYVIDFIEWHYYDKFAWPTFNVADAAITVGVGILVLDMILQKPEVASPRPEDELHKARHAGERVS
jgi:signal peptidase II